MRFVSIANGSLCELETHLLLARSIESSWMDEIDRMLQMAAEVGRMLIGCTLPSRNGPAKP